MRHQEPSHRQQKVATLINAALVEALMRGRMLDSRLIGSPVTITRVVVTADLKVANCYFLPFNTKLDETQLLEAFESSKHAIRSYVTEKIQLKYSPELRFHYDHGFDNAYKVEELLKNIKD